MVGQRLIEVEEISQPGTITATDGILRDPVAAELDPTSDPLDGEVLAGQPEEHKVENVASATQVADEAPVAQTREGRFQSEGPTQTAKLVHPPQQNAPGLERTLSGSKVDRPLAIWSALM